MQDATLTWIGVEASDCCVKAFPLQPEFEIYKEVHIMRIN